MFSLEIDNETVVEYMRAIFSKKDNTHFEYYVVTVDDTSLYFQSLNKMHSMIFEMNLPARWFSAFTAPPEPTTFTINLNYWAMLFSIFVDKETAKLRLEMEQEDHLEMTITQTDFGQRHWKMPLMTVESERMDLTSISGEFQFSFGMKTNFFATLVDKLHAFRGDWGIQVSETEFKWSKTTDEMGEICFTMDPEQVMESIECIEGALYEDTYKSDLLAKAASLHSICDDMLLTIAKNAPLKISYILTARDDERKSSKIYRNGFCNFYIAPFLG